MVAFCHAAKHEGLPKLILVDALFAGARCPVELVAKVDNTQVTKDHSKKLKLLKTKAKEVEK